MKKVSLPVSKSLYIRKLIFDFLKYHRLDDIEAGSPEDVRIVHESLCIIQRAETEQNQDGKVVRIDVRDCGAAYRFLMAVLAVTPGQWLLTGTPRLLQRPVDELVDALRSIGADIQYCSGRDARPCVSTEMPVQGCWFIRGKILHALELTIDCTRSGQFASALWLISEKIGLEKLHVLPKNLSSASYIAMTKEVVEEKADLNAKRLGDWSAAVYWYARLLLEGQLCKSQSPSSTDTVSFVAPASYKLLRLDLQSLQSDAIIAQWFSQWGIVSRQEEDGVTIEFSESIDSQSDTVPPYGKSVFRGEDLKLDKGFESQNDVIELDMSQNLDLVPVLACMACLWPKKMIFNGVANLKYKESNRLQIIQEQMSAFADIELYTYNGIVDNQLVVNPRRDRACPVSDFGGVLSRRDRVCPVSTVDNRSDIPSKTYFFDACNDHRFVMGFSLFALRGKVHIKDFDCVRKSYPDFKAEGVVAGADMVG